jgi:hypothetical protein
VPFENGNLQNHLHKFLILMGYESLREKIMITVGDFDCEGLLSPDEAQILITEDGLFHELGHAIAHIMNGEDGIYQTWSAVFQESMAETIDLIATQMLYNDTDRSLRCDDALLFHTRCAASALFEFVLWEQPTAAESLYEQYLGAFDDPEADPSLWALDTFRSIDPVFVYNYTVGGVVADRTVQYLRREFGLEYKAWGRWLEEHYFRSGRKLPLKAKLRSLGYAPTDPFT